LIGGTIIISLLGAISHFNLKLAIMKVHAVLLCLALVPLALAQAPPAVPEPEDPGFFGNLFNLFGLDNIDTDRLTQDATARLQKGFDLLDQSWTMLDEVLEEYSVDSLPELNMPPADEIVANITRKFEAVKAKAEERLEMIQQQARDFDIFELIDQVPDSDAETEAEPAAEEENDWWLW